MFVVLGATGKVVASTLLAQGKTVRDAAAIAAAGVGHVVLLSSTGAQHPDGTGTILSVHEELTHGLNTGRVAWQEGHPMWRGETDVEAVLASLIGGAR